VDLSVCVLQESCIEAGDVKSGVYRYMAIRTAQFALQNHSVRTTYVQS
jgi:hypothetical protein